MTYTYRPAVDSIIARGRFAHYLEAADAEFGELGVRVLEEVLQHGSICSDGISVPEHFSRINVDDMIEELRKSRWLRTIDLDPSQRKTMDLTEESRVGALGANFRMLNIVLARTMLGKLVEEHLGAACGLAFSALFRVAVGIKDDALKCTPQVVEEVMPFVQGHLSAEDVTAYLRQMHAESCCMGMITTTTKEMTEKAVAVDADPARRKAKAAARPKKVQAIEAKVQAGEKKSLEAFNIDWKAVRRKLHRDFRRRLVRQQFGVDSARVFALLDDNCERMFLVEQLTEQCLLDRKEVCEILNQLTLMNLVFWQEIPKGQHSAQCTPANVPNFGAGLWAYRTNQEKSTVHFRNLMAKSLHNLMLRFKDEVEGRSKIPPSLSRVALDSAQDILERTFLHLQLSYLAIRDI
eukprot:GEMP01044134.1.p1 GENE.GEMP01044134.1~~GEMP01044134.1.p1  ORF type:complete len:407 (+),score=87.06 GEMP01044134.1:428-1648(+)